MNLLLYTSINTRLLQNREKVTFYLLVSLFGLLLRIVLFNYESADYLYYLENWYAYFKKFGIMNGLSMQIGNYNIPYQIIIAVISTLPVKSLYAIKAVSIFFDYGCAVGAAYLTYLCCEKNKEVKAGISYCIVLFCPMVVLNSAMWAQCDAIYSCFIVWSLILLKNRKYGGAFFLLGSGLAFKLQAVLFIPFMIAILIGDRAYKKIHSSIMGVVAGWYVWCIPGFLAGRNVFDPISIYLLQTESGSNYMSFNASNFWAVIQLQGTVCKILAILLTFSILSVGMVFTYRNIDLSQPLLFIKYAAWFGWTCFMFLPNMHERYSYAVDIILLVALVLEWELWKIVLMQCLGILQSYIAILTGITPPLSHGLFSILSVTAYFMFTYQLIFKDRFEKQGNSMVEIESSTIGAKRNNG